MSKQKLFIMRGLPGSGKSTLAQKLAEENNAVIRSTDDEFIDEFGNYNFDPNRLEWFHLKNQTNAEVDLLFGHNVVIDNTNTCWREIYPYVSSARKVGAEVIMVEPETWWKFDIDELVKRNSHGVLHKSIKKMLQRWEKTEKLQKQVHFTMKVGDIMNPELLKNYSIELLNAFIGDFTRIIRYKFSNHKSVFDAGLIGEKPSVVLEKWLSYDDDSLNKAYMLEDLLNVEQESDWHPEIWLWEHTKQVCDMALEAAEKYELDRSNTELLLISALMHDIAKKETTKIRHVRGQDRITSYNHPEIGAPKAYDFCIQAGYTQDFARKVYVLVKEHMAHLQFKNGGSRKTYEKLIDKLNGVDINLLLALIEADISGRVADVSQLKLIEVPEVEILKAYAL